MPLFLVAYIKFSEGKVGGVYYDQENKSYMYSPIGSSFKKILIHPEAEHLQVLKLLPGKKAQAQDGAIGELMVNKAVAFEVGALIP